MSLKIRRGTNAERLTITPVEGELIYTTDTKNLYIGDGIIAGGKFITGVGYTGSASTSRGYTGSAGVGYTGSVPTGPAGYIGSFKGSIFSNDLTKIIDGNTLSFNNKIMEIVDNNIISSSLDGIRIHNDNLSVEGVTDGSSDFGTFISLKSKKGSLTNPENLLPNDITGGYGFLSWDNSLESFNVNSAMLNQIDDDIGTNTIPGKIIFIVKDKNNNLISSSFNSKGTFSVPTIQTGSYNGSLNYPTPVAGMIIFDSSNGHFYGFNGTIWKQLDN
jgi:hypothetical protein